MFTAFRLALLPLFCLTFLFACGSMYKEPNVPVITKLNQKLLTPNSGVMVVAHRGCWRLAPENSIESIEQCIEIGVDMVEIDVRQTKDNQLILMHDKTFDRTTNGTGLVADLTLAQVRSLYLKSFDGGDNAALTTQQVPTLADALVAAKGKILINLDAKGDVREQAFREASELGMLDHVLIKDSMSAPTTEFRQSSYYNKSHFMPIIKESKGDLAAMVQTFDNEPLQAYEVIFKTEHGLTKACEAARTQGVRCWVNTLWESLSPGYSDDRNVNDPDAHWGVLIKKFGVDMIQTDRPQLLLKYLKEQGLSKLDNNHFTQVSN